MYKIFHISTKRVVHYIIQIAARERSHQNKVITRFCCLIVFNGGNQLPEQDPMQIRWAPVSFNLCLHTQYHKVKIKLQGLCR